MNPNFLNPILILILAALLDFLGEPPEYIHPVVHIGNTVDFIDRNLKKNRSKTMGAIITLLIIFIFVFPASLLIQIRNLIMLGVLALLTKTMFSFNSLIEMVQDTVVGDLEEKREKVGKLVSRDVQDLNEDHLNSAAVETAAENITDSIVSPLFYFALLGFPGIVFYRVVNTMDAMIGYKNEEYKDFGWFTARLDDLLNFIPSRIAGILIVISKRNLKALKTLKDYRNIKLNPGWTISAMSGALNKKIEKKGHYTVNEEKDYPDNDDIIKALSIVKKVTMITIILSIILIYLGGPYLGT